MNILLLLVFALFHFSISFLQGHFQPRNTKGFIKVPFKYSLGKTLYLQKNVLKAFQKMHYTAKKEGLNIFLCSATRNYNAQKKIWEAKFLGHQKVDGINLAKHIKSKKVRIKIILKFSSMPGTSRHHWGTDIDLVASPKDQLQNHYFEKGVGLKLYQWLRKNASRFGFCQPYYLSPIKRNKKRIKIGYDEEKWHWSYKPLALKYFQKYKENMSKLKPKGFVGSDVGVKLYRDYILNVHSECLEDG